MREAFLFAPKVTLTRVLDEVHPSGAILLRPEIRLLQSGGATMPGRVPPIPARRVQNLLRLAKFNSFLISISVVLCAVSVSTPAQVAPASWHGTVRDARGNVMAGTQVELRETASDRTLTTTTDAQGAFIFPEVLAGNYAVLVRWHNKTTASREPLKIQPGDHLNSSCAGCRGWRMAGSPDGGGRRANASERP